MEESFIRAYKYVSLEEDTAIATPKVVSTSK